MQTRLDNYVVRRPT